jgi:LuxR family maltose regulon positive regulatory protein
LRARPGPVPLQYQVPQSGRLGPYDCHMSTPILGTKLYAPPLRPNAVPRPSLIERLDEGLQSRLILVSAPAGFGKTTIVSEWVAGCNRREQEVRPAWLSLDEGDSDSARFLAYLVAAVRTVAADVGQGVLGMLQSPQPPPTEAMLTALLNEITALPHGLVLVLDDYHLVDSEPVDEALAFLLEHLPPQMHLVIATREDPRLPLARWRARGQLTELRAADLRFTPSEAADFLNRVMSLDLSAEDITALETRTEGWIAGLQLAALSIHGRPDAAGFIQAFTGSNRFVVDYLVEEVLQRQPQRVRSFLLQTAILDKLCGALCDAITGQKHGKGMLELLERDNLFVVPLDEERQWYRYHHLFADVLQAHLLEEQPDQLHALHRRASDWYEENGSRSDAIRHALCAEDFGWAADLIELAGPMTEDSSQAATWFKWARALPDELIRSRPVLGVWFAWALLGSGELEAAEARLRDAERWLEPGPSQPDVVVDEEQLRSLLATIAVARAYKAHSVGDVPGTVKHAQRVFELLPEGDHVRRQQATALVGMTYWASGDLEAADRVFVDYSARLLAAGNIPDAISAMTVLPDVRPALGRLRGAVDTLTRLLQVVVERGEPLPSDTADLYRGLGELAIERGDLAAAAAHLLRSKELGEQGELPVWRWRWCVAQARFDETRGDLEGALALLDEAQRLFIRTPLPDARPLAALKARIWARQGRVAEASEWAREQGLSVDDDLSYLHELEHVTLARVLIVRGEREGVAGAVHDAAGLLERLLHAAEQGGRVGSVIEILALQALAHQAQGDTSSALALLERALSLAEPEGYVRVFVDEGPPMVRLLQEAASRGVAPDSARRLLAAFPSAKPDGSHPSEARCEGMELLSDREIEVLHLIATGLTNREIATRLYLSLYTVKAHARSIYDKLDAHSRTQAAARARELGILPLL